MGFCPGAMTGLVPAPMLPPYDSTSRLRGRPLHCGISIQLMSQMGSWTDQRRSHDESRSTLNEQTSVSADWNLLQCHKRTSGGCTRGRVLCRVREFFVSSGGYPWHVVPSCWK